MKKLLVITAALEAGTGLGFLTAPSVLARVLLGAPLDGFIEKKCADGLGDASAN